MLNSKYRSGIILFALTVGTLACHLLRIHHNPYFFWAPAIDQKLYGSLALNFLDGLGFRMDALEAYQFSKQSAGLDCYYFSFFHPFLITLGMKVFGRTDFLPILYSSAVYMALCVGGLFFVLRCELGFAFALIATFLFASNYEMLSLGPSGQSEPLMFLILILIACVVLRMPTHGGSFFAGMLLGIMNITRPTGMVLLPAFLFLSFRKTKVRGSLLFLCGFLLPTLLGIYLTSRGNLQYNRLSFPLVETESFGGPPDNLYVAAPRSFFNGWLQNLGPLASKVWDHFVRMISEPSVFWGDFWIFLIPMLILLWRKKSPWFGFLILAFLFSILSVVFYWYVPRVHLHLRLFCLVLAVFFLKLHFNRLKIWKYGVAILVGVVFAFLFSETRIGLFPKLVVQILASGFLSMVVLRGENVLSMRLLRRFAPRNDTSQPARNNEASPSLRASEAISSIMILALLFACQFREMNSVYKGYLRTQEPQPLFSFQKELMLLSLIGIDPKQSFILSDDIRDVIWFARGRGMYAPVNLCDMMEKLNELKEEKYIVLVNEPSREKILDYSQCGFELRDTPFQHLWIFEQHESSAVAELFWNQKGREHDLYL